MDLSDAHIRTLIVLIDRQPSDILWVLIGLRGLRLQGIEPPVNNIAVQNEKNWRPSAICKVIKGKEENGDE
jgi:hypothetical protein